MIIIKNQLILLLLELLVVENAVERERFIESLTEHNCLTDDATLQSVNQVLSLSFFTQNDCKKYGEQPLVYLDEDNVYRFNENISKSLAANPYFKTMVMDIVISAKEKSYAYDSHQALTLYKKYTRKDACRLLNWENDESSTMYGYKTKHQTCPIFVTYHKNDEVEASVNYGDEFINAEVLKWFTRSNRKLTSPEVKTIIEAKENQIDVHIFVKKDDDEGRDFYYLGKACPDKSTVEQTVMLDKEQKEIPVVTMNMVFEKPIEYKLYDYLVEGVE